MKKNKTKGFTLTEIMIVLVVIAVLVGTLLVSFNAFRHDAMLARARAGVASLGAAVEEYYRHQHVYPINITGAAVGTFPFNDFFDHQMLAKYILADPFLTDATTTPPTYGYEQETDSGGAVIGYVVWSNGTDGRRTFEYDAREVFLRGGDDIVASNLPVNP